MHPARAKAREVVALETIAEGVKSLQASQDRIEAKLDELLARPLTTNSVASTNSSGPKTK